MTFCLQRANLKPFLVILPGIWIQFWITRFISSHEKSPDGDRASSLSKCSQIRSRMTKGFRMTLQIWQIPSILGVFALDIIDFVQYIDKHPYETPLSIWFYFNCLVEILINSSNLKTCFSGLAFIQLLNVEPLSSNESVDHIQSQSAAPYVSMNSDSQSTQTAVDALDSEAMAVNNGRTLKHEIQKEWKKGEREMKCFKMSIVKQVYKTRGVLSAVLVVEYQLLYFVIFAVCGCVHVLPSSICYVWVWLSVMCGVGCLQCFFGFSIIGLLSCLCSKFNDDERFWRYLGCLLGLPMENIQDEEPIDLPSLIRSPTGNVFFVIGWITIPVLAQCYWYLGDLYIDALINVITERDTISYFKLAAQEYDSLFRLCTALL